MTKTNTGPTVWGETTMSGPRSSDRSVIGRNHRIIITAVNHGVVALDPTIALVSFSIDQTGTLIETSSTPDGPCCTRSIAIGAAGQFAAGGVVVACEQSGLPQTDVFAVDKSGALRGAWLPAGGSWTSPVALGPAGQFVSGAPLVACQQFGLDQTDVFAVDKSGALTVTWSGSDLQWKGPQRISSEAMFPPGAPLAACQQATLKQTDVFVVDHTGTVTVSWVDGAGTWNGPAQIGPVGLTVPGAHVCANAQPQLDRTNVCVGNRAGVLVVLWVVGGGAWNGPVPAPN